MKSNKFITSALVALGIVSLAGVAQANTIVYLTGSTAARAIIYAAATTSGQIFTGTGTVVSSGTGNTGNGANTIVFEGNITGVGTVDLDCSYTGSEAGIAAVANQPLNQSLPLDPNGTGPYPLPGVPPSFLTQASGWTTAAPLSIAVNGQTTPDLTMADTTQAVSRTPISTYKLTDYGLVGIVPFTFMKGYEATPDQSWNDVVNVTTAEINQLIAGPFVVNFITGNPLDTDGAYLVGRNLGSGTRVNTLLNLQYALTQPVDQWSYGATYPSGTPGVLTFGGSYAAGQPLVEIGNDGYDSGGSVQKVLNVDGTGSSSVLIGYVGISDGANAHVNTVGGPATYLSFNGVYESDSAVINGNYPYWGQEHLLGNNTESSSSAQGKTGAAIVTGINAQLVSSGAGTKGGAVGPTYTAQSVLVPVGAMQATRGTDGGFPSQGTF